MLIFCALSACRNKQLKLYACCVHFNETECYKRLTNKVLPVSFAKSLQFLAPSLGKSRLLRFL